MVPLGDYVDRGPDSRGVLDWLIGFDSRHPDASLVPLRGNHEVMLLAARDGDAAAARTWLGCGGAAALASYAVPGGRPSLDDVPEEHWAFLENRLVPFHEADGHFFRPRQRLRGVPFSGAAGLHAVLGILARVAAAARERQDHGHRPHAPADGPAAGHALRGLHRYRGLPGELAELFVRRDRRTVAGGRAGADASDVAGRGVNVRPARS